MNPLTWPFLQPLRLNLEWWRIALALAAVLCVPLAAAQADLRLPALAFSLAALPGLLLGAYSARIPPPRPPLVRVLLLLLWLGLVLLPGALLLLLLVGNALPPLLLILRDVGAAVERLVAFVRREELDSPPFIGYTWAFLNESLPRFLADLRAAPDGGRTGTRLITATGGVVLTWVGALALGYALLAGRPLLVWALPLLAALLFTTILGSTPAMPLFISLAALLLLAISGEHTRRERGWDQVGTDYSLELRIDLLTWGGLTVLVTLLCAWLLPAWLSNPVASALWQNVEPPSALVVPERGPRPQPSGPQPGVSQLPALDLSQSLEQGPPDQLALRIQLTAALPEADEPRYWRARVLHIYNGRGWTTDALVNPLAALPIDQNPPDGALVQTMRDERPNQSLLIGLPNIIGVDVPAQGERLADGTLAALTIDEPVVTYRVLSRPPQAADAAFPPDAPPDLAPYLRVPRNLPPRVGELARALVIDQPSQYQRALALERYLRELPYSYEVTPLPAGGDAVAQFLFEMRQGYCTYYASAMAVMARTLDIPARVAVGYATGEYDPASRTYTVYEAEAHAWPELYINGRWTAFEPTPVRALPARGTESRSGTSTQPVVAPQPDRSTGPLIWVAVLVALIGISTLGWWLGRRGPIRWSRAPWSHAPNNQIAQIQRQLEQLGTRAGVTWPRGATLYEYSRLLAPRLDHSADALTTVTDLLVRAHYGQRGLSDAEQRRLSQAWQGVRAELARAGRTS